VLFISPGSRIPSVLKLNWIPPGPFAATAVDVGFERGDGGVCGGASEKTFLGGGFKELRGTRAW